MASTDKYLFGDINRIEIAHNKYTIQCTELYRPLTHIILDTDTVIVCIVKLQTGLSQDQVPHMWDLIMAQACLSQALYLKKNIAKNDIFKLMQTTFKAAILYPSIQLVNISGGNIYVNPLQNVCILLKRQITIESNIF